jgi:hypothetical protein
MKKLIAMLVLVGFTSVLTVSVYAQENTPKQEQGKDKGKDKKKHHHHHDKDHDKDHKGGERK